MAADMRSSLVTFLQKEMQPQPGRANFSLTITISCAVIILLSMSLQIPFLAVSLIVVFYACQSNVIATSITALIFTLICTLAVIFAFILVKMTFEYPLLRIVCSCIVFFIAIYLLCVVNYVGQSFFLVALVVIYSQTFPDYISDAELVVRLILWVWIAVIYAICVTVIVSFCVAGAYPIYQFRKLCLDLLGQVQSTLHYISNKHLPLPHTVSLYDLAKWQNQLTALLKLARLDNTDMERHKAVYISHMSAVLRLYNAIAQLQISPVLKKTDEQQAGILGDAVQQYRNNFFHLPSWKKGYLKLPAIDSSHIVLHEIENTLKKLSSGQNITLPPGEPDKEPLLAPDAFENPTPFRFALKTLLATMICYLFYLSVDWQGIHTIMLSCVIVAQPGLGTTLQKSLLRLGGASIGSLFALFIVVFIQPYTDSIVGLLLMTAPVIALGAWVATGSQRISYVGTQLTFTFALAIFSGFGPVTNLTEIRDRIIGIFLGIGVSAIIHIHIWPDSQLPLLKKRMAQLYRLLAAHIHQGHDIMASPKLMQMLAQTNTLVNRVVLEPVHNPKFNNTRTPSPPIKETLDKATKIVQLINLCHIRHYRDGPILTGCAHMLTSYANHILSSALPEHKLVKPFLKISSDGNSIHALAHAIATLPDWRAPSLPWMRELK